MLKLLIPVILVGIVALTLLIIHKRETRLKHLKNVERENRNYKVLVENLDRRATDEYTVTNNLFAGSVLDAIERHRSKEIA